MIELVTGGVAAGIFGLVAGSFSGATVWRLRAKQLVADKKMGEKVSSKELKTLKPLASVKLSKDRSRCLHCAHTLAWYDLIPIASWLSTKGKCRYCKKPIGHLEPIIELGSAALFIAFYLYWMTQADMTIWLLLAWVPALILFVIAFVYDLKWFILPDQIVFPLIGLSAIVAGYQIAIDAEPATKVLSVAGAVLILSGLYLALWLVSRGNWVGFGDVKLGIALGFFLADWKLAFLALFLANLLGTLIVLPGLLTKKLTRKTIVPFGPLLIAGFFIALFFGQPLIDWYISFTNSLVSTTLML